MPALNGRGREGEKRKREREGDTFTTIVTVLTTTAATYTPAPVPSSRRGAPSQRNYAKSPTRKIRDTTSRRVPTCCIVISENLPRTTCIRILGLTVRSRSWISRRRIDGSLARFRASYRRYAHRFARNQTDFSYTDIFIRKYYACSSESNYKPHISSWMLFNFNDLRYLFINPLNIEH